MNLEGCSEGLKRPSALHLGTARLWANMAAAAVGRLLSFSKNARTFIAPLRLSSVPFHRYGVEVSSTGEAITHTGQVRSDIPV